MPTQPIEAPTTYRRYESKLDDDHNLFQCNNCGHFAGDPRPQNFYAKCPACDRRVRFYRLIE